MTLDSACNYDRPNAPLTCTARLLLAVLHSMCPAELTLYSPFKTEFQNDISISHKCFSFKVVNLETPTIKEDMLSNTKNVGHQAPLIGK